MELFPLGAATLLTFALAWVVIVLVPGPTVTLIVANSLRSGTKAGIANVAGTQAAVGSMVLVLAFGLETVISAFAALFFWIKLFGAAYLVWIGVNLWRSSFRNESVVFAPVKLGSTRGSVEFRRFFWQGFAVL